MADYRAIYELSNTKNSRPIKINRDFFMVYDSIFNTIYIQKVIFLRVIGRFIF